MKLSDTQPLCAPTANNVVSVAGIEIGRERVIVIAGPCAVESFGQTLQAAQAVKAAGATLLRGGAFKPRTSPYSFQGLEDKGLEILADVSERTGLGVVSEMTSPDQDFLFRDLVDMIQIGTRNMANYKLLKAAAKTGKPILLKRGFAATLREWIMAAEYILNEGNQDVVMCERGIRTFGDHARYTLDLSAMLALRELGARLPIIVDPSHAAGIVSQVPSLAKAAVACGADGLLVEVHPDPINARCDGDQSLDSTQFMKLMVELAPVARAVGKRIF